MSWMLFSILAAMCWSIVNVADKFIITKLIRKPVVPVIILGSLGLISSLVIYFVNGFSQLSPFNTLLALIAGALYIWAVFLYYDAIKLDEISRIIPLFYITPLFVLIFAGIFLGEIFNFTKYIGIFLLVTGAILISIRKFQINLGKAFWLMMLVSLILAVNSVIQKHLLNSTDFWTVFSYIRIGSFFAVVPVFFFNRKDLSSTMRKKGGKTVVLLSLNELLGLAGVLLFTIATALGPVTLANALSSVQPFFVLLIAVALSLFFPKILKEEIGKSIIALKLLAIALMFVGVFLIS